MFIQLIEKIRKRTHQERRFFALIFAGIITGLVTIIWVSTLSTRLSGNLLPPPEEISQESGPGAEQQGAVFGAFSGGAREIKELVKGSARYFKNFSKPLEYERGNDEPPLIKGTNVLQ